MLTKQSLRNNGNNNLQSASSGELAVNKKKELEVIINETLRQVIDMMDSTVSLDKMDTIQKQHFLEKINFKVDVVLNEFNKNLSQRDKERIVRDVSDEILGFGPIDSLIHDPSVTEIMVNGYNQVFVELKGKLTKTEVCFRDNAHVIHTIDKIITPHWSL